jgi:hypothetical protein
MLMRKFAALTLFIGACGTLARAQQGTPEQRVACESDAIRFCSRYIPNADRIAVCLKENRDKISATCNSALFGELNSAKNPGVSRQK